jgi:hypothetical protein
MKRLFIAFTVFVFLFAACRANTAPGETVDSGTNPAGTQQIKYVHDTKHGVGCWFFIDEHGTSLSCLPDSQYTP